MNTLGREGEELAVRFLRKQGFRILEKNYRTPFGEIDIVADDQGVLVFIEVKTRRGDSFGYPFEAVDRRKRDKIRKVALSYLKKIRKEPPARFDVLSIDFEGGRKNIDHIKDAFEV
ncbi:MAG: YraN family protein [Nitrospiraceae bacterium]|nr:YraN family protein [Nitrospiraceae bacterium]